MSQILELYKSTDNETFTRLITEAAPYFNTIDPLFVDLRAGYAEVSVNAKIKCTKNANEKCATIKSQ